tara:strand:- start:867 stop:1046 length:180 start_codon:yes stop_codon:yes gene_type:complete
MIKTMFGGCSFSFSQEKRNGKRKTKRINFFIRFDLLKVLKLKKFQLIGELNLLWIKSYI